MPSKTVHSGLLKTALSEGTWNHVNKIKDYLVEHIGDPDRDGMKDVYYIIAPTGKTIKAGVVPQHGNKDITRAIYSYHFWNSVCYYLNGNYEKAGEMLARAIHYTQDSIFGYSSYNPNHDVVEDAIYQTWIKMKQDIVERVRPELEDIDDGKEVQPGVVTEPYLYLVNALKSTYYVLTKFEKMVDDAQNPGLGKPKAKKPLIGVGIATMVISAFLFTLSPVAGGIGLLTGITLLSLGFTTGDKSNENSAYLLWVNGRVYLDLTRWPLPRTIRTRRGHMQVQDTLILQPYVSQCQPVKRL